MSGNGSRPWNPGPLILGSVAWHVLIVAGVVISPAHWALGISALLFNHVVLTLVGLWPRSSLLGPNWTQLPERARARGEVAITIDDGPDPVVTPQVLDILERYGAKATFFCVGQLAREHAELCAEIVRRGHVLENHSQSHSRAFSLFGLARIDRELAEGQQSLYSVSGSYPRFFRAPAGLRNPFLEPVLARHNLLLASWTRRGFDTREGSAEKVTARLLRDLQAGDILLLHDGNAARTRAGNPVILEVLPRLLDAVASANLHPVTLRSVLP